MNRVFERDVILSLIGFAPDNKNSVQIAEWLAAVPPSSRDLAQAMAERAFATVKDKDASTETLTNFAAQIAFYAQEAYRKGILK